MVAAISSKADLEKALEPFSSFSKKIRGIYKAHLEQYPTPTSIAAHLVWIASLKNAIRGLTVADLGCGNCILATASLMAGSVRAICIDIDEEMLVHALKLLLENYRQVIHRTIFVVGDAATIELNNVDTVITNPPFGVFQHNRGIDLRFLENALRNARHVYSIHKYSRKFMTVLEKRLKSAFNFDLSWLEVSSLEIPMIYGRHRRRVYRVKVLLLGLTKR